MALKIIVGDTSDYLARDSKSIYPESTLLFNNNYSSRKKQVYFTSLGDLDHNLLYQLLIECDDIIYHPPTEWSDINTKIGTESLIKKINLLHDKDIKDIHGAIIKFPMSYKFLDLVDHRKTQSQQIWISGCSFAKGVALESDKQRYGQIVSSYFDLPVSFLVKEGSSIDWANDQILRADIRPGDILIWALTGVNRTTWFDKEHKMLPLTFSFLTPSYPHLENKRPDSNEKIAIYNMLFDDSRLLLNIRHVEQVRAMCVRHKIYLLITIHPELSQDKHAYHMIEYLKTLQSDNATYLDLESASHPWQLPKKIEQSFFQKINFLNHRKFDDGSNSLRYKNNYQDVYQDAGRDNLHPGPLTHQNWAGKIIERIKEKKWVKGKS